MMVMAILWPSILLRCSFSLIHCTMSAVLGLGSADAECVDEKQDLEAPTTVGATEPLVLADKSTVFL